MKLKILLLDIPGFGFSFQYSQIWVKVFLGKTYSYTIGVLNPKSMTIRCRSRNCSASLCVVFDPAVVKVNRGNFANEDISVLEDISNFK